MNRLKFSVIKILPAHIVYIQDNGAIASVKITANLLRDTINEIKKFDINNKNKISTIHIRTILLILGKGSLKSYDVYTNIDTSTLLKSEIKKTILNPKVWINERTKLHNNLVEQYLENVKYLSNKIENSNNLEKALYFTRGTIASGKSIFLSNYLYKNIPQLNDVNGIINTDQIKRLLIEKTENLSGLSVTGYLFHDEASMLSEAVLVKANQKKLLYCVDKRMHDDGDFKKIIVNAKKRKLPVVIFDIHVDFITSALRVLDRDGVYPSDPTSNFESLLKSYKKIEKGRNFFLKNSLKSVSVKDFYRLIFNRDGEAKLIAFKKDYKILKHADRYLIDCIDEKSLKNVIMPSGKSLKEELNEHSRNVYKNKIVKEDYFARFLENIKNTSRSYSGNINVSASEDKRSKMNVDLSKVLIGNKVKENLEEGFNFIYNNKNIILDNALTLKYFINKIALIVNKGLLLGEQHLIRTGKNSTKYNYIDTDNVEMFYDEFVKKLYLKILDVSVSRIEISAWLEWNIDFSGHIFSDGCGRIAKLISSWLLIRDNKSLPNYSLRQDDFDTIRSSYRKRFSPKEKIKYIHPFEDDNYIQFLNYYKELFKDDIKKRKIFASGGLIYNKKGEFLILQTSKGKDSGKWVIPGGKLEINEVPIDAFKREIFEETGLKVNDIILIGSRDYKAINGNQYHFYEYTANVKYELNIKINEESLSFEWIKEDEVNNFTFTDSVKNFLDKYFLKHMSDYYKVVEKIDYEYLDVPHFEAHTMHESLKKYVEVKLPVKELRKFIPSVSEFELHGIYPDLKIISELNLNFKIIEVISQSASKKNNSNSVRPIFLLVEKNSKKIIMCCAIPGRDHILHYASMIGFFLKDIDIKLSVFAYPVAERKIDKWTDLDETMIYKNDIVILGYSTYYKKLFLSDKNFTLLTTSQNRFYVSTRFLCSSGNIVNCFESSYGPWGDISDFLAHKICQLGANEIIHIGKVGTLSSPTEVYKRIYIPSSFVVARRNEVFFNEASVKNSMEYIEEHSSFSHVSITATMEETLKQRNHFENHLIETVDMESSKIAQSIALYNLRSDKKVKFGAIHFSSDYLRKSNEANLNFDFDLTTTRENLKDKKEVILNEIFEIIKKHL